MLMLKSLPRGSDDKDSANPEGQESKCKQKYGT